MEYRELSQHRPCNRISLENREKTVFSTIRHPFERYVSQYFFGWWRTKSQYYFDVEKVKNKYPELPEVKFETFVKLSSEEFGRLFLPKCVNECQLGWYTRSFIRFFYNDPHHDCFKIDNKYIDEGRWDEDVMDVQFLRTSNLNEGLYNLLVDVGYKPEDVSFVFDMGKVRPTEAVKERGDTTVDDLFTPELKDYVRQRDRLLFEMFPEFKDEY